MMSNESWFSTPTSADLSTGWHEATVAIVGDVEPSANGNPMVKVSFAVDGQLSYVSAYMVGWVYDKLAKAVGAPTWAKEHLLGQRVALFLQVKDVNGMEVVDVVATRHIDAPRSADEFRAAAQTAPRKAAAAAFSDDDDVF